MIMFQVVQVVLSVVAFSKTALIFWKNIVKYREFLPISGKLNASTLGSFSLVVSPYKSKGKKINPCGKGGKIEQNACFQRQLYICSTCLNFEYSI